jgi:hypothetical protein
VSENRKIALLRGKLFIFLKKVDHVELKKMRIYTDLKKCKHALKEKYSPKSLKENMVF